MSWSDDTRCLFCDGKLSMFRKRAQGQFCSKAHQEAYWKEQDQLAVAALHRTQEAIQAYKPAASIESILGPSAASPSPVAEPTPEVAELQIPELQGLRSQAGLSQPFARRGPGIAVAEPVEYEVHWNAAAPRTVVEETAERTLAQLAGMLELLRQPAAVEPLRQPVTVEPPVPSSVDFVLPAVMGPVLKVTPSGDALGSTERERVENDAVARDAFPREAFPQVEHLLPLTGPKPAPVGMTASTPSGEEFHIPGPQLPKTALWEAKPFALAASAGMLGLSVTNSPRNWTPGVTASSGPVEMRRVEMGPGDVAMSGARMGRSGGSDAMVDLLASVGCAPSCPLPELVPQGNEAAVSPVSYYAFEVAGLVQFPSVSASVPQVRVQSDRLLPLGLAEKIRARGDVRLRAGFVAEPFTGEQRLPKSKLAPSGADALPGVENALLQQDRPWSRVIAGTVDFWNHAPRDLKILLFAVPLALGLAFHPSLPKVSVQAPSPDTKEVTGQFQQVLNAKMDTLKKSIADRAAIGLDENFRQGLDNWMSHSGSTAEWSFDQAGFVQPGRVALYQPSLGLTDYEFQFLGAIDKGALSWVARAVDFQNYYVVKLVVLKGGPVPQMGITRYAVIDGQPRDRVDTPVTFQSRTDSLYRVSMVMEGDRYSLVIQGQMIDTWNEPRLKRGGVGFFTNKGESSRIGWVQITHQYDMLGRFFAYLAP